MEGAANEERAKGGNIDKNRARCVGKQHGENIEGSPSNSQPLKLFGVWRGAEEPPGERERERERRGERNGVELRERERENQLRIQRRIESEEEGKCATGIRQSGAMDPKRPV